MGWRLGSGVGRRTARTCLDDLERRRNNAWYLDALGEEGVSDSTMAADFTRRFFETMVGTLMVTGNSLRVKLWEQKLPPSKRRLAVIDANGTFVSTTGEWQEGMGVSYNGA